MPRTASIQDLDVLIVGAGFDGLYSLHLFRKLGFNVKIFEKGTTLGGIWHWNRYPGARVDSDYFVYQYSDPELWRGWTWSERFPGWEELREYYFYVDEKWKLSSDIYYSTTVVGARFDEATHYWNVSLSNGDNIRTRWFVPAMGFAAKPYSPDFKNIDVFKGTAVRTSLRPQVGLDLADKRVAIIGTGATGVQVIQEIGPQVKHLTIFQRTPNMTLPIHQTKLNENSETIRKENGTYAQILGILRQAFCGYEFQFKDDNLRDVPIEQHRAVFEQLWAYLFWAEKTRAIIIDPHFKGLLAPLTPPHPFGTKRLSLEQAYYEVFNQANVDLINVHESPVKGFTETGIRTKHCLIDVDAVILATGFDSMTGSFTQLDIRGTDGRSIEEHWKKGVDSYLGLSSHSFPNMFVIYGPQAPSSSSNGPTILDLQAEYISDLVQSMANRAITRVEAEVGAENGLQGF
ncbi:hypothetical protein N7448_010978 [Penicillium atrosanguineum]|nr:hypothetical protein N7448_010978 [Penicillium atrosanguineum]